MNADDYMAKASRAIASAKLLLDAGDVDGGCNRAYYAMFDAAHAALLWASVHVNPAETKTHHGLIAAFGKHLVKTGLLAADLGKALNQVERVRLLADYTGEEVDEEKARWAVEQAELFLESVKHHLGGER
ncbi:MAG: HEPN domain-containing protein [Pseudomonadota bacterium]